MSSTRYFGFPFSNPACWTIPHKMIQVREELVLNAITLRGLISRNTREQDVIGLISLITDHPSLARGDRMGSGTSAYKSTE
jgi:hypothetical protein